MARSKTSPAPPARTGLTFDDVRALARALPGVEEGTSYGTPAFKVAGKLLARLKEDGETLVVKVDMDARDMLVRSDPETFFFTDHYAAYPMVLVRLPRVERAALGALLEEAYRTHAPKRILEAARTTEPTAPKGARHAQAAPAANGARPAKAATAAKDATRPGTAKGATIGTKGAAAAMPAAAVKPAAAKKAAAAAELAAAKEPAAAKRPAAAKKAPATAIDPLARVREICLALPDAAEGINHGRPCFEVAGKTFVMFMDNHHGDGRLAIWCKAPPGAQGTLVEADPTRYFVPPYVGPRGWLGARLDTRPDWSAVAACIEESWRMTAPKRTLAKRAPAHKLAKRAALRMSAVR